MATKKTKKLTPREARVYQALDELSDALGEFDGDEELKAIAPLQTIIGE